MLMNEIILIIDFALDLKKKNRKKSEQKSEKNENNRFEFKIMLTIFER